MKRHDKPCVVGSSATCVYLADGTKIVVRRGKGVKGSAWLEVVPQDIIGLQNCPSQRDEP